MRPTTMGLMAILMRVAEEAHYHDEGEWEAEVFYLVAGVEGEGGVKRR